MGAGLWMRVAGKLHACVSAYSGLSKAKRATIWITLCSFLQRAISFITVPVFTRLLNTAEYGELSVYTSWQAVAMYVITLGVIYGGFNNGMMRYRDDREGYASSVMGLVLVMGAFIMLAATAVVGVAVSLSSETLASWLTIPLVFFAAVVMYASYWPMYRDLFGDVD